MTATLDQPEITIRSIGPAPIPHTPLSVEKPATKQTWEQAYKTVTEGSQLLKIINGEIPDSEWMAAVTIDISATNKFIQNFMADLRTMTGKNLEFSVDRDISPPSLSKDFKNLKKRVQKLHKEIFEAFDLHVHGIINNLGCKRNRRKAASDTERRSGQRDFTGHETLNCGKVEWGTSIASFNFAPAANFGASSADRYKITLANPCLKDPDDFTRKVPARITTKLAMLKGLNYNYCAKILDGYLVGYEKNTEKADGRIGRFRNTIREVMEDPGLAVTIDGNQYVIDFWKEPYPSQANDNFQRVKHHPAWIVIACAAVFFGLATFWWFGTTGGETLLGTLGCAIVAIMTGIAGICVACSVNDWMEKKRTSWKL